MRIDCRKVADVWEKDVWEFQAKSGCSGSCRLFLHFLGKIAVQKLSGRRPGSPRHPSSRHPRPSVIVLPKATCKKISWQARVSLTIFGCEFWFFGLCVQSVFFCPCFCFTMRNCSPESWQNFFFLSQVRVSRQISGANFVFCICVRLVFFG